MKIDFDSVVNLPTPRLHGEDLDSADTTKVAESRLISSILSPAVRLFLRSQLKKVEELQVKIDGGDRQILRGTLPRVSLLAKGAVYKDLHLTQVEIVATDIQVNIGEIVRGKPLRLLHPFPITGELLLQQADFNASITSLLLNNALVEFLLPLLSSASVACSFASLAARLYPAQIVFEENSFTLMATLVENTDKQISFVIRAGLQVFGGRELHFVNPELQVSQGTIISNLHNFKLDLGPEVELQELKLSPGQLLCRGKVIVIP
ncbi:MAG: DUF2993 domain-containing protein [Oscillatoriaceae bacterium SKW80]|nr:DUF2993 domain-containing protein [Oscillatoriaceae bacterium SKYG93]MCX8120209.1 DUF2993 domain-containing protein [Oscillatoriaceae bacterium SKW80]MDW8453135.1 DUF2993 domain-containing protein [Oscillatoriaceae cyanobacterium SKYGB_i_bin93]HIK28953.1 DUF2993 domain-containing protein [Oscillatoriaceae cyanobacterium M7585_C2015_266]